MELSGRMARTQQDCTSFVPKSNDFSHDAQLGNFVSVSFNSRIVARDMQHTKRSAMTAFYGLGLKKGWLI